MKRRMVHGQVYNLKTWKGKNRRRAILGRVKTPNVSGRRTVTTEGWPERGTQGYPTTKTSNWTEREKGRAERTRRKDRSGGKEGSQYDQGKWKGEHPDENNSSSEKNFFRTPDGSVFVQQP